MHGAVGGRGPVGLIERDRELAALDGVLDAASGSDGGILLPEGPAGRGGHVVDENVIRAAVGLARHGPGPDV